MSDGTTAPSLRRAIDLLALLAQTPSLPLSVADFAREVGAAPSSLRNICRALEEGGLIQRVDAGYLLGPRLVELAGSYLYSLEQVERFHQACAGSPLLSRELVQVAVLDGADALYLARHEGRPPLIASARLGSRRPASATAVGAALLSVLDDEAIGARSAGDTSLLGRVQGVRDHGYATEVGGVHGAVTGIAAPVPGAGRVFAVGVSLVGVRLRGEEIEKYGRAVQSVAAQMAPPPRSA